MKLPDFGLDKLFQQGASIFGFQAAGMSARPTDAIL
jgi:hypothetical protein